MLNSFMTGIMITGVVVGGLYYKTTQNKFSKAYTFNKDDDANIEFKKYMNYLLDKNLDLKYLMSFLKFLRLMKKLIHSI